MRQTVSFPVRVNPRFRHTVVRAGLKPLTSLALLAMVGVMLGGCILEVPTPTLDVSKGRDRMPLDETGPWTYRDPTEKELLLARSDFSVEIVRFTDSRRPRSMEMMTRDKLIYQYDPDVLMGGVSYQVPGILGKYLSYRPKMPKHYKVEIDVKRMVQVIKTGTFWSGSWGRYSVDLELAVIARRPDSTVAWQGTYRFNEEQPRDDSGGRGPSKELDRARMFDLTEATLRKAAESIGWDLRMRDARKWKVVAPQTVPGRLNLPPVDYASGGEDVKPVPASILMQVSPDVPERVQGEVAPDVPVLLPEAPVDDEGTPAPQMIEPVGTMGPVI